MLYSSIDEAVKSIAHKYAQSPFVDEQDLAQNLWLHACEKGLKEEFKKSPGSVVTVLKNRATDVYRYLKRRYLTDNPVGDSGSYIDTGRVFESDSIELVDLINDLMGLFPENSKEKLYLLAKMHECGIGDPSGRFELSKLDTETKIAQWLGFTGTSNRAFKRIKSNVRSRVKSYLCS